MDIYRHRNEKLIPANDLRLEGNIEKAIAAYTDAIHQLGGLDDPEYALENYLSRGLAYRAKGMFPQALADYDEAVRMASLHSMSRYAPTLEAYFYRANARAVMGDAASAIHDHQAALHIAQSHAQDSAKMQLFCVHPNDVHLAISDCNQALATTPGAATFYYFRGMAQQVVGEFSLALDDYEMAQVSTQDVTLQTLCKRHLRAIQEKMSMVNPFDSNLMRPNMDYCRVSIDEVSHQVSVDEFDVEKHEQRSFDAVAIDEFREQLESEGWNLTGTHVGSDSTEYYYQRHKR